MDTVGDEVLRRAGIYAACADSGENVHQSTTVGSIKMSQESSSNMQGLDAQQKETLRAALVETAKKLIGVPYLFGAEWSDITKMPEALDCSELCEGVYHQNGLKMPDGSQNQFNFCVHSPNPLPGDLAFFGRGGKETEIYHVGMVYSESDVIEARGFQPGSSFETGKVILRPISAWIAYKNFISFRSHPRLA